MADETAPSPSLDGPPTRRAGLPQLLLEAADWFNEALIAAMVVRGWPLLSRSQSLVFFSIDDEGTRPAELARRLGITRQSMQELLVKFREQDLVTVDVDPHDRRATIVRLAPRAQLLGFDAAMIAHQLEGLLEMRLGPGAVADAHHSPMMPTPI